VIGDEAHLFTGKSLSGILEKCTDSPYRFGFTGTVSSDSKCVDKNTLISTDKGSKKIKDIKVGDIVLSYNEIEKSLEHKQVLRKMNNGISKTLIKITTKSGSINVTGDHKVFTDRGWVMAKDITQKDKIAKI
jgi:intein/homing endonuclease